MIVPVYHKKLKVQVIFLLVAFIISITFPSVTYAHNDSQNPYGGMRFSADIRASIESLDVTAVQSFINPVPTIPVEDLVDTWGDARSQGRTHEGIDIMANRGTPVISPTPAVVKRIRYGTAHGGTLVYTANPGGEVFYFAHLDTVAPNLFEGQMLAVGDVIGTVGNSGNASNGPTHLHFGIYTKTGAVNPFPRLTHTTPPSTVATPLPEKPTLPAPTLPTQNLKLGNKGEQVRLLQNILIIEKKGPSAINLAEKGATGYFGPLTQQALIEYQKAMNITPAQGYFGPRTREALSKNIPA